MQMLVVPAATKAGKRHRTGLVFGLMTALIFFLLLSSGVFRSVDTALHALVMQMGFTNPRTNSDVVVIKKDQITSELLEKNPDREEFASLFRFLGQPQIVERRAGRSPVGYTLFQLELGLFSEIRDLPIKTSFSEWSGFSDGKENLSGNNFQRQNEEKVAESLDHKGWRTTSRQVREFFKQHPEKAGFTGFMRIQEQMWLPAGQNLLKGLAASRDFLLLPTLATNWRDKALVDYISALSNFDGAKDLEIIDEQEQFKPQIELLKSWENFFANLARSDMSLYFDFFPTPETAFRIILRMEIAPPFNEYPVEPAAIIGFDFVLQGEKRKEIDSLLEEAIGAAESKIILAGHTKIEEEIGTTTDESRSGVMYEASKTQETRFVSRQIMPHQRFMKNNVDMALIDVAMGNKGYVSEIPMFVISERDKRIYPTFSLKIAARALDKRHPEMQPGYTEAMYAEFSRIYDSVVSGNFSGPLRINDLEIPVNSYGRMLIDFVGSTSRGKFQDLAIKSVSMYECFDKPLLEKFSARMPAKKPLNPKFAHQRTLDYKGNMGNKIVLVGPFEVSDFDFFPTPLDFDTPYRSFKSQLMGIEIHANAVINLLERRFIRHPNFWHTMVALLISCLFLGYLLDVLTPGAGAVVTIIFMGTAFWQSYESYHVGRQIFNVAALLFSYPFIWVLATLTNYIRQRLQAKVTKDMFSRFVAADVVQYMLDNPELVRPGGEKVELTIFFSDVAGFTSISEALSPEDLVVLLNEYLGAMTDLLFEYGGTLDKFIGDAVMAFWNFPRKQSDHAVRACLCALAMQRKITELQISWAERGLPKVSARAGLNTAGVVVGYMGSQKAQMNFTCMGDGVNLAARLEGANKEYGTMLMIGDATYQQAKHAITVRFLDFLAVKGKKEPVKVHELVCEKGKEPPEWDELAALYDEGIQLHLDRKWDEAIAAFEKVLAKWPDDGPSATYIARCQEYKVHPPPEGWDGRYILTHK